MKKPTKYTFYFFFIGCATYYNLSSTLQKMSQHAPDHWVSKNFTKTAVFWNSVGLFSTLCFTQVLLRHETHSPTLCILYPLGTITQCSGSLEFVKYQCSHGLWSLCFGKKSREIDRQHGTLTMLSLPGKTATSGGPYNMEKKVLTGHNCISSTRSYATFLQ